MGLPVVVLIIAGPLATKQQIPHMTASVAPSRARSPQFSFSGSEHTLVAGVFADRMDGQRLELKRQRLKTPSNTRVRADVVATEALDVLAGLEEELRLGRGCPAFLLTEASQTRYPPQG